MEFAILFRRQLVATVTWIREKSFSNIKRTEVSVMKSAAYSVVHWA